jgi:hypothetical protein
MSNFVFGRTAPVVMLAELDTTLDRNAVSADYNILRLMIIPVSEHRQGSMVARNTVLALD